MLHDENPKKQTGSITSYKAKANLMAMSGRKYRGWFRMSNWMFSSGTNEGPH